MHQFINSGILETYVLGCASDEESAEVLQMARKHPEVKAALNELEIDLEILAHKMAIAPPANTWNKIEQEMDEIMLREQMPAEPVLFKEAPHKQPNFDNNTQPFINIEAESTHMRVHKSWKWIFAAVFLLGKIFLGFAIYFYIQSIRAEQKIDNLQQEIRQLKGK